MLSLHCSQKIPRTDIQGLFAYSGARHVHMQKSAKQEVGLPQGRALLGSRTPANDTWIAEKLPILVPQFPQECTVIAFARSVLARRYVAC
jgi:hypothetical protein